MTNRGFSSEVQHEFCLIHTAASARCPERPLALTVLTVYKISLEHTETLETVHDFEGRLWTPG